MNKKYFHPSRFSNAENINFDINWTVLALTSLVKSKYTITWSNRKKSTTTK